MIDIIPAIDIINGRCVRLKQGDFDAKTEYAANPLDMAKRFEDHGIERLHLVDLDGARAKQIVNYKVLEDIASKTGLIIDFGGGIRSNSDVRIAFESGAHMLTGGSIAVKNRQLFLDWLGNFGPEKIILGADFKEGNIAVSGWEEKTDLELITYLTGFFENGVKSAICTDISLDGMLEGPSIEAYNLIKKEIPGINLIASGGIAEMNDLKQLQENGIEGVIIGKSIYEGRIELDDIERFIMENG